MTDFRQQLKPRFAVLGVVVLAVLGLLLARLWTHAGAQRRRLRRRRPRRTASARSRPTRRAGASSTATGRALVTNRPTLAVVVAPVREGRRRRCSRASRRVLDVPVAEIKERVSSVKAGRRSRRASWPSTFRIDDGRLPRRARERVPRRRGARRRRCASTRRARSLRTSSATPARSRRPSSSRARLRRLRARRHRGQGRRRELVRDACCRATAARQLIEVDAAGRAATGHRGERARRRPRRRADHRQSRCRRSPRRRWRRRCEDAHKDKFPKAKAGAAVALDVKTGEVLAMASLPDLRPRRCSSAGSRRRTGSRSPPTTSEFPLTNRAIMAQYPPARRSRRSPGWPACEDGVHHASGRPTTAQGRWTGMGEQWKKWCWNHSGHGTETFMEGIEDSCDIVFYEIGYASTRTRARSCRSSRAGSASGPRAGIDLPGEVDGPRPGRRVEEDVQRGLPRVPAVAARRHRQHGHRAGRPARDAAAARCDSYAGIANGGKVMKPHVLKQVLDADGEPGAHGRSRRSRSTAKASKRNLATMQTALVSVTERRHRQGRLRGLPRDRRRQDRNRAGRRQGRLRAGSSATLPPRSPGTPSPSSVEQGGHGGSVAGPAARQILAALSRPEDRARHRRRTRRGDRVNERARLWFVNWPLLAVVAAARRVRQPDGAVGDVRAWTAAPGMFKRHLLGLAIGLVPLVVAWAFDYRKLQGWIGPLLLLDALLILSPRIPGLGDDREGRDVVARRSAASGCSSRPSRRSCSPSS